MERGKVGQVGLWDPQETWAEWEGRLQQVIYCRDRDEAGGLGLKERRKQGRSSVSLSQLNSDGVFTRNTCWCWRLGYWYDLGIRKTDMGSVEVSKIF